MSHFSEWKEMQTIIHKILSELILLNPNSEIWTKLIQLDGYLIFDRKWRGIVSNIGNFELVISFARYCNNCI